MKKLGFGFMRLPLLDPSDDTNINWELLEQLVDRYLEAGFSYFDTALPYHSGASESAIKRVLSDRHRREEFVLADKIPTWLISDPEEFQRLFYSQLEKCGVEYFDYYMLHSIRQKNYKIAEECGGFELVKKLKAEGKIKHIGISYHDNAELLDQILIEHPEIEFVQILINYAAWDSLFLQSGKCYEVACRHGKKVSVTQPVMGGVLSKLPDVVENEMRQLQPELSTSSWGIRYAASLENVFMVLSGMNTMEQLEDNIGYMQDFVPLDSREQEVIRHAQQYFDSQKPIPCVGCGACKKVCPKNLPVPDFFSIYNDQALFGLMPGLHKMNYYDNYMRAYDRASACIGCGLCEEVCSQKIEIVKSMKQVSEVLDSKSQGVQPYTRFAKA